MAPDQYPQSPHLRLRRLNIRSRPEPPSRTPQGLDAVIDISAHTAVSDFRLVRASNILAVIHKASEGDFYADPMCAERRSQAEASGLLWGTYHFGKRDSSGGQQALFFLDSSRPGPRTLLALDLEPNESDPSNSKTREQAEAFVQAVASATGRLSLIYVHPTWANGGARIIHDQGVGEAFPISFLGFMLDEPAKLAVRRSDRSDTFFKDLTETGTLVGLTTPAPRESTVLKRPGRAEEVAAAILFLASDDASYVTGALLFVDGGMTAV